MERKILITGGVRSGKSRFALDSALSYPLPRVFLATAEPLDQEMRERILRHQAEREGQFVTIEEPLHLAERILHVDCNPSVIVVDCLTIWLGNVYHRFAESDSAVQNQTDRLIHVVKNAQRNMIVVTNEVGLGVVPDQVLGRRFVDRLGALNQELARICDEVVVMTCGMPHIIKGALQNAKVDESITAH